MSNTDFSIRLESGESRRDNPYGLLLGEIQQYQGFCESLNSCEFSYGIHHAVENGTIVYSRGHRPSLCISNFKSQISNRTIAARWARG